MNNKKRKKKKGKKEGGGVLGREKNEGNKMCHLLICTCMYIYIYKNAGMYRNPLFSNSL